VYIIVPGWIVAELAGAQAALGLSVDAERACAAAAGWTLTTAVATAAAARIANAARARCATDVTGRVMRMDPPAIRCRLGVGTVGDMGDGGCHSPQRPHRRRVTDR
jgi:hypothetical protein